MQRQLRPMTGDDRRYCHGIESSEPLELAEDVAFEAVLGSKLDQQLTDRARAKTPEVIDQSVEARIAPQR
jgi:hypothetical protein